MKTLLICPGRRPAVPLLSVELPLAALPILGECLAGHWIEHLAAQGARDIRLVAADRIDSLRECVGDGARWGVRLEFIAAASEPTPAEAVARYRAADEPGWLPPPFDVVAMNHLPGCPAHPLFESYADWFSAVVAWMPRALTPVRVRVSEVSPGIWIGRRAHVSPLAQLVAPCWIGDQVFVGKDAVVGPGAVLEDRSVVDRGARVVHGIVGPDTYVGRHTAVGCSLAGGPALTNWRSGSWLRVPDPFLLCSLVSRPKRRALGAVQRRLRALARAAVFPLHLLSRATAGFLAVNRH